MLQNDPSSPDLFAVMTFHNNEPGTIGIAWVGTACRPDWGKGSRSSINEYYNTDARTGQVSTNTF